MKGGYPQKAEENLGETKQKLYDMLVKKIGKLKLHELLFILRRRYTNYQYDMARIIDISPGKYSTIEKGLSEITDADAEKLLRYIEELPDQIEG